MKVLVTGANGFIGSNLCACLAHRPGIEPTALVRPASDRSFLSGLHGVPVLVGDITQPETLVPAFEGAGIVYHVAGFAADWGPWQAFRAANVMGVRNVLEAARRHRLRRVVHISSVSVYGFPGRADIDEATAFTPRPTDRYITTKAEGDRLAMSHHGDGLEVVVVRPAAVYGANDRTTTMQLVPALLKGRFGFVDGGIHLMAPLYIDNLTQLIALAGEVPAIHWLDVRGSSDPPAAPVAAAHARMARRRRDGRPCQGGGHEAQRFNQQISHPCRHERQSLFHCQGQALAGIRPCGQHPRRHPSDHRLVSRLCAALCPVSGAGMTGTTPSLTSDASED
jgi:nucleoside-diphosphate-sugar epimerase